jgi:hypothetical protein
VNTGFNTASYSFQFTRRVPTPTPGSSNTSNSQTKLRTFDLILKSRLLSNSRYISNYSADRRISELSAALRRYPCVTYFCSRLGLRRCAAFGMRRQTFKGAAQRVLSTGGYHLHTAHRLHTAHPGLCQVLPTADGYTSISSLDRSF